MAVQLDQIRAAAERVALSHHLEVVDVVFAGAGKHSTLQVFLEKDAAFRAEMAKKADELAESGQAGISAALAESAGIPEFPRGVPVEALSGITHEDCAAFAQDFGTLLDVEELVPGSTEYTLEVSSPGLERGLFKAADYERFAGSLVKVKTFQPVQGTRNLTGRMSFDNGVVMLDLAAVKQKGKKPTGKKPESQMVEIPLGQIEKAQLVPEF